MDDQTRKSPPPSQQRERRFLLFARTRFRLSEFGLRLDRASIFLISAFRFGIPRALLIFVILG